MKTTGAGYLTIYLLSSIRLIRQNTFGSIIKLLSMIKTALASPNVKYTRPRKQAESLRLLLLFVISSKKFNELLRIRVYSCFILCFIAINNLSICLPSGVRLLKIRCSSVQLQGSPTPRYQINKKWCKFGINQCINYPSIHRVRIGDN